MSELPLSLGALDVEAELEKVARGLSEADAARVRTLIYLASRQQAQVITISPMTDREYIEALKPIMMGAGRNLCQLAFNEAFKHTKDTIDTMPAKIDYGMELPAWAEEKVRKIK